MSAILDKTAALIVYNDGRLVCRPTSAGKKQYKAFREQAWANSKGRCCLCGLPVALEMCVYAHSVSRGGGKRDDRPEVNGIAHYLGNSAQGSISLEKYLKLPLEKRIANCRGW